MSHFVYDRSHFFYIYEGSHISIYQKSHICLILYMISPIFYIYMRVLI